MERRNIPPQNRAARPNRPRNHEVKTKRIILAEKETNTESIDHRFYEERYARCVIYINSLHDYINLLLQRLDAFANVKLPEMPSILQTPVRPAKPATPGTKTKTYRESENDRKVFVCNDGKFTNGYGCITRMMEENEFVQQIKNTPLEKRWVDDSEEEEECNYIYDYKPHVKKFLMEEDDGVVWDIDRKNPKILKPRTESETRMNNLTKKIPIQIKNKQLTTKQTFQNFPTIAENARPKTPSSPTTTGNILRFQTLKKESEEKKETPDNPPKPGDVKTEEVQTPQVVLQDLVKNFQKENLPAEIVSTYEQKNRTPSPVKNGLLTRRASNMHLKRTRSTIQKLRALGGSVESPPRVPSDMDIHMTSDILNLIVNIMHMPVQDDAEVVPPETFEEGDKLLKKLQVAIFNQEEECDERFSSTKL